MKEKKKLLEQKSEFTKEAISHKDDADKKLAIGAVKKKKLVESELQKLALTKIQVEKKLSALGDKFISDPMFVGLKNALGAMRLGKRGKYKPETEQEFQTEVKDYFAGVAANNEDDLLKELEELDDAAIQYLHFHDLFQNCLLYTSDAADDTPCVDLGGRRIIKKKKYTKKQQTEVHHKNKKCLFAQNSTEKPNKQYR
eukprot:TRINITY_DN2053_c0_g1_i1.p2 TRINITY_DN2053_c0_g1~~TRINITY_DN2053_c0_g1_i1.p2  ORF type:complete len:198 (-),score=58.66 TRINITY_DN2053_c0_g1_i1:19-612(-)